MERTTLPSRAARGPAVGAVCALGAALAHLGAGGVVTPAALALVLVVSVAAAPVVLRAGPDPAGTLALALVVQVAWHGAWTLTAPGAAGVTHSAAAMLLTHLLAALASTVVALAVERELLAAAARAVGWLRPVGRRLVPALLTPSGPVRSVGAAGRPRRLVARAGSGAVCGLRAPPGGVVEHVPTLLARP